MIFPKLILCSAIALIPTLAHSAMCTQQSISDAQCAAIPEPAKNIPHCASYMFDFSLCYATPSGTRKKFYTCNACDDGYILVVNPDFINMGCDATSGNVYVCEACATAKSCNPNTKPEETDWRTSWTGYESKSHPECNTTTCKWENKSEYRCANGYYGHSADIKENYIEGFGVAGMTGCTLCPMGATINTPLNGMSDTGDNETINRCYLDGETYTSDFTGSFTIISDDNRCYYN